RLSIHMVQVVRSLLPSRPLWHVVRLWRRPLLVLNTILQGLSVMPLVWDMGMVLSSIFGNGSNNVMEHTFQDQFRSNLASRLALHVLVDPEWSRGRNVLTVASAAIDGGATVIQLRDKKASTRLLVEQGLALRKLTREHGVLLIVNDRVDVALAV